MEKQENLNINKPQLSKKDKIIHEIISWLIIIAIAFVAAEIVTKFIIMKAEIISESMVPEFLKDDHVIGSRLSYVFSDPERGDVVFFEYPRSDYALNIRNRENKVYVKRIIGLPGEKVEIRDGKVYINDDHVPLDEPYLNEVPVGSFGPYFVPADCYFMLGDNRNISVDSRYWVNPDLDENGNPDKENNPDKYRFVSRDAIYAKAWLRFKRADDISLSFVNHHEYEYDYYGINPPY